MSTLLRNVFIHSLVLYQQEGYVFILFSFLFFVQNKQARQTVKFLLFMKKKASRHTHIRFFKKLNNVYVFLKQIKSTLAVFLKTFLIIFKRNHA